MTGALQVGDVYIWRESGGYKNDTELLAGKLRGKFHVVTVVGFDLITNLIDILPCDSLLTATMRLNTFVLLKRYNDLTLLVKL